MLFNLSKRTPNKHSEGMLFDFWKYSECSEHSACFPFGAAKLTNFFRKRKNNSKESAPNQIVSFRGCASAG